MSDSPAPVLPPTFDGGTHAQHVWVAIGHEQADVAAYQPSYQDDRGFTRVPLVFPDIRRYVVRACARCPVVWWQEYDQAAAMALVP